mmetsp:Transcript_4984/g.5754  ORF Transcript_4984/g.5754 Transcript_4984/m.5754 type:complete len:316 (+) Transcript_4984:149-1096(+)
MIYYSATPTCCCYSVLFLLICGLSVDVCQSFAPPPSATTSTTTSSPTRTTIAPASTTTVSYDTHTQNKGITERTLFKLGSLKRLGKKIATQHQYQLQSTVTVGETTTLMPTTSTSTSTPTSTSSTTLLLERPPQLTVVSPITAPMKRSIPKPSKRRKILIEDSISSLSELKYFLEDDERPVVIKFYAKWCKKCQRLGRHFDRLAMDMGDCIVDQQMIDGDVRFAAIEYTPASQEFLTNELQIQGLPTLQMYVGTRKLFDESGASGMKQIIHELDHIEDMSHDELLARAESADDGVLSSLIEESFYDSPDFLNEEW